MLTIASPLLPTLETLFVVPDLEYRYHGRQVVELAKLNTSSGSRVRVLNLSGTGLLQRELPEGTAIEIKRVRRLVPPSGWAEFHSALRREPPLKLHTWGRVAAWAARAACLGLLSGPRWQHSPLIGEKKSVWDGWLLRNCERILLPHPSMVTGDRQGLLSPIQAEEIEDRIAGPILPEGAVPIVIVGRMDCFAAFRDAIWAFDILRQSDDSLHLVLIGDGPSRSRLEEYLQSGRLECVHFAGPDVPPDPWLRRAAAIWIPTDAYGGIHRILEACRSGKPVVAPSSNHLEPFLKDHPGVATYRPSRPVELAIKTQEILMVVRRSICNIKS